MSRRSAVALAALLVALDVAAFLVLRYRVSEPPAPPEGFVAPDLLVDAVSALDRPIAGPLFLAGSDEGHVLRVTRGSCADDVTATAWVAAPDDQAAEVSLPGGLVQALATGYDRARDQWWIVGADAACEPTAWTGELAGGSWTAAEIPDEAWFPDPADDTRLTTRRGPLSLGSDCHALSATVAGPSVYVVCADGQLLGGLREDRQLSSLALDVTAVGVALGQDGRIAVATSDDACLAGVLQLRGDDSQDTDEHCFGNTKVALGAAWSGDVLSVQVGFALMTEDDGDWIDRG